MLAPIARIRKPSISVLVPTHFQSAALALRPLPPYLRPAQCLRIRNFHAGEKRCIPRGRQELRHGTVTPEPDDPKRPPSKSPFYFEAGYALYAKRPSRPFPPPFLSVPSTSFSEPLSTHDKSRDRRPTVDGQMIRGVTNGDDAVLVSDSFIGANDGVGAWGTIPAAPGCG